MKPNAGRPCCHMAQSRVRRLVATAYLNFHRHTIANVGAGDLDSDIAATPRSANGAWRGDQQGTSGAGKAAGPVIQRLGQGLDVVSGIAYRLGAVLKMSSAVGSNLPHSAISFTPKPGTYATYLVGANGDALSIGATRPALSAWRFVTVFGVVDLRRRREGARSIRCWLRWERPDW